MTQDNASTIANPVSAQGADSCLTCVYWKTDTSDTTSGECRIDRPVVLALSDTIVTVFPRTGDSEWCGSHEGVDDGRDEDYEQGDKPSYQELCEMLTAALECTGSTLERLDAASAVIADQSVADQYRRRLVFHRVLNKDMETLNSVFANLKAKEAVQAQGQVDHEADELAEATQDILNEEEAPLPDKE